MPWTTAELSGAGVLSPMMFGRLTCPTMIMGTPASMAARKGTRSTVSNSSLVASMVMAPSWESPAAAPIPGKCFAQQSIFLSRKPSTSARTISAATAASLENERRPMVSLRNGFTTSATGAKSRLNPSGAR